jgi:hypothetical protein
MSDLVLGSDLNAMVEGYLAELAGALSRLPTSRRDHLVGEIREHIVELRSERPPRDRSDMEALLNRVGLPEDIAAVALEDLDEPPTEAMPPVPVGSFTRWRHGLSNRVLVGAATAVIVLVVVVAGVLASGRSGSVSRSFIVQPARLPRVPGTPNLPTSVLVTMPNVIGQTQAQAEATLAAVGLNGAIQVVSSSTAPSGTVLTQSPASGSLVLRRGTVDLTVSSGPLPPGTAS